MDTDEDWLLAVDNAQDFVTEAMREGWEISGSLNYETDFISLKRTTVAPAAVAEYGTEVNLIIAMNKKFFRLFMIATELAKSFNLLNRNDRVRLFKAILYGSRDAD